MAAAAAAMAVTIKRVKDPINDDESTNGGEGEAKHNDKFDKNLPTC